MSGLAFTVNFRDGNKRTKNQLHRLGITAPGELPGEQWTYVQFAEAVAFGNVVRDQAGSDLIGNSGIGTVSTATAKGGTTLIDASEFGADADKFLVGALGFIHVNEGIGTSFYVKRWVDANTLEIEVIASGTKLLGGGGWPVATDATSSTETKYSLYAPGWVKKGSAAGFSRGVATSAAKKNEYGWVKQKGWCPVSIDASAANMVRRDGLIPTSSGLVQGFDAVASSPTQSDVQATRLESVRNIGLWPWQDLGGSTDMACLAWINIENDMVSFRFSDDDLALNQVTVA